MQTAIVTGATGFVGYHFLKELLDRNLYVYVVIRPHSQHKSRLVGLQNIKIIELDMDEILQLPQQVERPCEVFFHLGWECGQRGFASQNLNIRRTLQALEAASSIGCTRFVGVGSQAEYGICHGLITEEVNPHPITAYGAAKLAACHLSRYRASELNIEWVWARLFSVYGPYDGENTLLSYLIKSFKSGETPKLTQAMHPWDYLYVADAAKALYELGRMGANGEIYNVANGDVNPLRYFVEQIHQYMEPNAMIEYGEHNKIIVPLNVSVEKILKDTDWRAKISFKEGVAITMKNNEAGL